MFRDGSPRKVAIKNQAMKRKTNDEGVELQDNRPGVPQENLIQGAQSRLTDNQGPSAYDPQARPVTAEMKLAALASQIKDALLSLEFPDLPQVVGILRRFEEAQGDSLDNSHKSALSECYLTLTRIYTATESPIPALYMAIKVLELKGYVIVIHVTRERPNRFEVKARGTDDMMTIETWMHISKAFASFGETGADQQMKAEGKAWSCWHWYHGHSHTFDQEKYSMIRRPIFEGIDLAERFQKAQS